MAQRYLQTTQKRQHRQRGMTLVEALVALLIMSFGMVALMGMQSNLRRSADLARQRGEATRLAQQEIERLRSYSVLLRPDNAASNVAAYSDISALDATIDAAGPNSPTAFRLTRSVGEWPQPQALPQPQAQLKALRVHVAWTDHSGNDQFVLLDSMISHADPALGGSLGIAPTAAQHRPRAGRNAQIPAAAKPLEGEPNSSVFKPLSQGTLAWVFNNLTGLISGRCTVNAASSAATLTAADLAQCTNNSAGYLLSGFVRFSDTLPPDALHPSGTALPLALGLTQLSPEPLQAPGFECFDDAPTGASASLFVSYYCAVYPNGAAQRVWSGRLDVLGLALGGNDWKVCRYSADDDGNGQISNAEHPLSYTAVTSPLSQQNFLVIRAAATCPAGQAINPANGVFASNATVLHQPAGVDTPR
jgi:type II secretory pathway pseudopilin PulG